jgi:nucleotide-binding universal stress UspA family protein
MRLPLRSVLCATDLSPLGNLAAEVALRLMGDGGTLHLIHVDAPPKLGNPLYPDDRPRNATTPAEVEAHRTDLRTRLQALAAATVGERAVRTVIDVVESSEIALAIEGEAKRRDAEAVVLSSHGRWGLSRFVHGESVAIRLLHRPDIDVVVVHTDRP